MSIPRLLFVMALATIMLSVAMGASAQTAPQSSAALFAVEFRTGPAWEAEKPAHEQAYFREHSANLKSLRQRGVLVLGARYGDKGLVILSAASEAAARELVEQDPAVSNGTFVYELNAFSVFYGGDLQPRPRAVE